MGLLKGYYTAIHSGRGGARLRKEAQRVEDQINARIRMSFANEAEWRQWVLNNHRDRWTNCTKCPLGPACDEPVAMGEGAMEPLLVIVTGAPGQEELIHKLCEKAELDFDRNVYLTSMVACRPRKGDPLTGHVQACRPRLQVSLDTLRPYVILLMGSPALELLGLSLREEVEDWRGLVSKEHWPEMDLRANWNLKAVLVTECPSRLRHKKTKHDKSVLLGQILEDVRKAKRVVELLDSKVERSFLDPKEER